MDKTREFVEEMVEALETLPLDRFGNDMSKCDASDFADHAWEFFQAMQMAKAVIAKWRVL